MNRAIQGRRPELLAPGGSFEGMTAAVNAGADAVYMGGSRFGARAYAQNPDEEMLLEAIDYCHLHGRKLYLTVNTLLKEEELETQLYPYLRPYYERGLDAVLVQDLGAAAFLKEVFPGLALHASTQMSVQSVQGAQLARQLGFERVVPARELSVKEIAAIYEATGMEIECFVHGALCYSYSGQCLLSSLIGGRSGNRGRCAQPCRQAYELEDAAGKVLSKKAEPYLLSLKDISTIELLPDLIGAGVCSFKIEGRMKRAEYAAGVVSVYRYYLDRILEGRPCEKTDPEDLRRLMDLYNRGGFSRGYYYVDHSPAMMSMKRPNHAGTPALKVLKSGSAPVCTALEDLKAGDHIEVGENGGKQPVEITLREDHPRGSKVTLPAGSVQGKAREGRVFSRVRSDSLLRDLEARYLKGTLKEKINGKFMLRHHAPAILEVSLCGISVRTEGAEPGQALTRATGEADIRKQLEKTKDTPFCFEDLRIEADDGCFFPFGEINRMRRNALEQLREAYLDQFARQPVPAVQARPEYPDRKQKADIKLRASVGTDAQLRETLKAPLISRIYIDCLKYLDLIGNKKAGTGASECAERDLQQVHGSGRECFLMFPPVWRTHAAERFCEVFSLDLLRQYDGLLILNADQIPAARETGLPFVSDAGLYSWNSRAVMALEELGAGEQVMPAELNMRELSQVRGGSRELIIYGYQPVMTCAQCLMADTAGCTHKPALLMLRDRMNMRFPVRTHCGICTNVIYNALPLRLFDQWKDCAMTGADAFRIRFTVEDGEQTAAVLKQIGHIPEKGADPAKITGDQRGREDFTRGHFKRGVE